MLSDYDDDLAADATRQANRLREALTTLSPPPERVCDPRLEHAAVRALLARYPTPSALRAAGKARIQRLVTARAPRSADRLARDIGAALDAQTVTVATEDRLGHVIAELAGELELLQVHRDRLGGEIEAVFTAHPLGLVLASLPGIGPRTGAKLLAEIMLLAALCSLRSPASKAFYARKRATGKRHTTVVCLARRCCDVILAILKTVTPYDPTRTVRLSETPALAA